MVSCDSVGQVNDVGDDFDALSGLIVLRSVSAYSFEIRRRHRHARDEVRIAQELRAVGEGAPHRFGDQVQVLRRAVAVGLEVVALQHVQHLGHGDAAGAGRRHADDLVAAVGAAGGLALLRLVLLQVVAGDEAVVGLHLLLDQRRGLAFVEPGRALVGNALERLREVGLLQDVAGLVGRAVLRELRQRGRVLLELVEEHAGRANGPGRG